MKYYKKACKYNHADAIHVLGIYYYDIKKYKKMKKYYEKNIINNYIPSFFNYGLYYALKENNFKLTKLYFLHYIRYYNKQNKNNMTNHLDKCIHFLYVGIYKSYNYNLL